MANRVLRRPMFRMGGSPSFEFQEKTSGILSGLDGPKLNASRTGYKPGGVVLDLSESSGIEDLGKNKKIIDESGAFDLMDYNEHTNSPMKELIAAAASSNTSNANTNTGTKTDKASRLEELFEEQMRIGKKYAAEDEGRSAGMPGSMSSALMTFGLNLLGQPGGNLAGAIGKAGSPALSKFQAAREAERLDKRKTEREMRRDALDRAFDLREAEIEADAEIKSEMGKDNRFAFEATQDTMKKLQDDEKGLIKEISDLEKKQTDGSITDEEIVILEEKKTDKSNNEELQILITKEKKTDPVAEAILKGVANGVFTFEDYKAYKESGEYPAGMKDGGRAGYQMGGDVVEDVSMMSETATVSPTAPAQTQDLTYDELRSRLPREITNDVVSLISTSKAALTDFANIQTQQDVDNFNQTYNVNLVLPQEG